MNKALLITTAFAMATLVTSELSHSRTMGHYAPGVVGVRDLVVPPSPGFSTPNTMPFMRPIVMSMVMATND